MLNGNINSPIGHLRSNHGLFPNNELRTTCFPFRFHCFIVLEIPSCRKLEPRIL